MLGRELAEGARTCRARRGERGGRPGLARSARSANSVSLHGRRGAARRRSTSSPALRARRGRRLDRLGARVRPRGDRGARGAPATSSTAARRRCRSSSSGFEPPDARRPRLGRRAPTPPSSGAINDARLRLAAGAGMAPALADAARAATGLRLYRATATEASPPACSATIDHDRATSASTSSPPHPEHRGRGLATRLMTAALVEARERGSRPRRCRRSPMGRRSTRGSATAPTSRCACTSAGGAAMSRAPSDEELEAAVERARRDAGALRRGRGAGRAARRRRCSGSSPRRSSRRLVRRGARGRAGARRWRSRTRPSAARAVRTLLAEEARMGMMVGVAVGWALAEELQNEQEGGLRWRSSSSATRRSSSPTATRRCSIDPFLAPNNPAAKVSADEVEPTHILLTHGHSDHIGRRGRGRQAHRRPVRRDHRARRLARRAGGREGHRTRTSAARSSSTGAASSWSRPGTRTRPPTGPRSAPAAGLVIEIGGDDRLPPRRHGAVRRPGADRRAPLPRRRPGPDRRPLHDGPPRRRLRLRPDRRADRDPVPLQHLPADRDRRRGVQGRGRVRDLAPRSSSSSPGETA